MPRRFDVSYDLVTQKVHLLSKNASGETDKMLLVVNFSSLTQANGFVDSGNRLTQAGFLQVNALIAQAVKTRTPNSGLAPLVPVGVIGDNGESLRRAAEGHLDDTTSKDGQATIRPWPSKTIDGAKTNLTVGVLTMNTHFSSEAWKSPLRFFNFCSSEKGYGAHKVADKDVRGSVRTASAQLDYLATQVDTVAVHYYVNGKPSYGTGHASNSGASAVLEPEYESLMLPKATTPSVSLAALHGEGKEAEQETPAKPGVIELSHMLPAQGTGHDVVKIEIVRANTRPQDNSKGFDLGDMEAARGHASCCAPSLYTRSLPCSAAAKGGASGSATGEAKEGAAPYGTFPE